MCHFKDFRKQSPLLSKDAPEGKSERFPFLVWRNCGKLLFQSIPLFPHILYHLISLVLFIDRLCNPLNPYLHIIPVLWND